MFEREEECLNQIHALHDSFLWRSRHLALTYDDSSETEENKTSDVKAYTRPNFLTKASFGIFYLSILSNKMLYVFQILNFVLCLFILIEVMSRGILNTSTNNVRVLPLKEFQFLYFLHLIHSP